MQKRLSTLILPALLMVCGINLLSADWTQWGNNPQRTGYSSETITGPYKVDWKVDLVEINAKYRLHAAVQPIVAGGKVFIGSKSGTFFCFNAENGNLIWQVDTSGPIMQTAGYQDNKVYVANMRGDVYAFNPTDGSQIWKFNNGRKLGFSTAVLLAENNIYISDRGGRFFSIKQSDGTENWHYDTGAPVLQSAAFNNGKVFYGAEDARVHALNTSNGTQIWQSEKLTEHVSFIDYYPVCAGGKVIVRQMIPVRHTETNSLFILDEDTGNQSIAISPHYNFAMTGPHTPPAIIGDGRMVLPYKTRHDGDFSYSGWAFHAIANDTNGSGYQMLTTSSPVWNGTTQFANGAPDETRAVSVAGDCVIVVHHSGRGWGNPDFQNAVFQISTGNFWNWPKPSKLQVYDCTQTGGASAVSISNNRMFHQAHHMLYSVIKQ